MKKFILTLGLAAFTACLAIVSHACSDDDDIPPFVTVTGEDGNDFTSKTFDAGGGTVAIDVSSNTDWRIEAVGSSAAWLSLSPAAANGNATVQVDVQPNTSLDVRTAKFAVTATGVGAVEFVINQTGVEAAIAVTPEAENVPAGGGRFSFAVICNTSWTYTVDSPDVTELEKTDGSLVLNFPAATDSQTADFTITFSYAGNSYPLTVTRLGLAAPSRIADLMDIKFLPDGTAVDISPMNHTVVTTPGTALMTYYNATHNRYVANFRHPMGANVTSGYYRINYTKGGEFINRIADGCTFESIIKLNEPDNPSAEVKWFSSMQAGGIGFILPIHNASNPATKCMTFLPNVSTTGSSNWRWTYSDVEPQAGRYYHVVGVWNKSEGRSYIYINGRLAGTQSAPGSYVPVVAGAESFILGGDPDTSQTNCASAWNGEIVTARIYDDPFTAERVAELWNEARFDDNMDLISVSGLEYLASCQVTPGCKYSVYGTGFAAGDQVELQPEAGGSSFTPATAVSDGRITITVPSGMPSGEYKFILCRGNSRSPLFKVSFAVADNIVNLAAPKVVAHRGAHTDGASENSLAALIKAMDAGYYGIELDVWITTDGQLVVHHDGVVNGQRFDNATYDQIKNITLSNGESLPTFDSFLTVFKNKMATSPSKLIIEIKTHDRLSRSYAATDLVMQLVEAAGLKDRVEYIAFSYDVCKRVVSKCPTAMVGYLSGNKAPSEIIVDGIRSIDYSSAVLYSHPEWIAEARRQGMISNVWTVNSASDMLNFMSQGIDYITTDQPALCARLASQTFIEP